MILQLFPAGNSEAKFAVIIGIGDDGCRIISQLYKRNSFKDDVDFFALNRDEKNLALLDLPLSNKVLIGETITKCNDAGDNSVKEQLLGEESFKMITDKLNLNNYHQSGFAFIIGGLEGGNDTEVVLNIAKLCKNKGLYTISICSIPSTYESLQRQESSIEQINRIERAVDNVILFSNDGILNSKPTTVDSVFKESVEIFYTPIEIILSVILTVTPISVDYADVYEILQSSKLIATAYGIAKGEKRLIQAFENLVKSPFLSKIKLNQPQKILLLISTFEDAQINMEEIGEFNDFIKTFYSDSDITWAIGTTPILAPNEIKMSAIISGIAVEYEIIESIDSNNHQ